MQSRRFQRWAHAAAILTVCIVALVTHSNAFAQTAVNPIVKPGDAIRITVWGHPELSGEFPVTAEGYIAQPVYQRIKAAQMDNATALREALAEVLRSFDKDPKFVVEALYRVVVGGEVRQPNLYLLPAGTTIGQAVGLAGGSSERAELRSISLTRSGAEQVVDLTNAAGQGSDVPIQSGDRIYVHRKISVFRDYVLPSLSVAAAIASIANLIRR